jgi:hypothetical protein
VFPFATSLSVDFVSSILVTFDWFSVGSAREAGSVQGQLPELAPGAGT